MNFAGKKGTITDESGKSYETGDWEMDIQKLPIYGWWFIPDDNPCNIRRATLTLSDISHIPITATFFQYELTCESLTFSGDMIRTSDGFSVNESNITVSGGWEKSQTPTWLERLKNWLSPEMTREN